MNPQQQQAQPPSLPQQTERAILAGGCFWGVQDLIRKMPGVIVTRVGYSGGDVPNATYRRHGTHAEAIEIVFDPARLEFRTLLEFFFQIHDPTSKNRQGNDVGLSYRSAIFYTKRSQAHCRGNDRRRQRFGAVARASGHGAGRLRAFLGSRAGAPELSRALAERLHLPFRASRLEATGARAGSGRAALSRPHSVACKSGRRGGLTRAEGVCWSPSCRRKLSPGGVRRSLVHECPMFASAHRCSSKGLTSFFARRRQEFTWHRNLAASACPLF